MQPAIATPTVSLRDRTTGWRRSVQSPTRSQLNRFPHIVAPTCTLPVSIGFDYRFFYYSKVIPTQNDSAHHTDSETTFGFKKNILFFEIFRKNGGSFGDML